MIGQTNTKPQETLEFKMNKQMEVFSLAPPINLVQEAMISFEATISVFIITDENNSFSKSIPSFRRTLNYLKDNKIDKLKNLLKYKSKNDAELHVQEVRKR